MSIKQIYLLALILLFLSNSIKSQNKKIELNGYLHYINTTWNSKQNVNWLEVSSVHNRLDLHWYVNKLFTWYVGLRNNIDYGSMLAKYYPYYKNNIIQDNGPLNLTYVWTNQINYLFYTNIDRLNLKYNYKKLEITLGRQRINWGVNLIWNPNDIFNTYNYFDFSYINRPGSDAARIEYYLGNLSSVQMAAKLNRKRQLTAAAMYKFNLENYDFQLLSGVMNKKYFTLGGGWDGQISDVGFTGEITYFTHLKNDSTSRMQIIASVSANYIFRNNLSMDTSILYNSSGKTKNIIQRNFLISDNLSPQTLTLSKLNLFWRFTYPLTPLIKADFSTILNPYDNSVFLGPSLDFNLSNSMDLLTMGQLFVGKDKTEYGDLGQMYYFRFKWSF